MQNKKPKNITQKIAKKGEVIKSLCHPEGDYYSEMTQIDNYRLKFSTPSEAAEDGL